MQFKSCGVNASCVCQKESSLKVVVSMHHVFINMVAVQKLQCQCIMCLSTRKQFKSCGVYLLRCYQQRSGVIVVVSMYDLIIKKEAVFKSSLS